MDSRTLAVLFCLLCFVAEMIVYAVLSVRTFRKVKEMRNVFNCISTVSLLCFFLLRISSMLVYAFDLRGQQLLNHWVKIYIYF